MAGSLGRNFGGWNGSARSDAAPNGRRDAGPGVSVARQRERMALMPVRCLAGGSLYLAGNGSWANGSDCA
jgi:hypothetical protein